MTSNAEYPKRPVPGGDAVVKRRGLLRIGTLLTAFTGTSAMHVAAADTAQAGSGDKAPTNSYVPLAEKASPLGVATLDGNAKIVSAQLPDLSAIYAKREAVQLRDFLDPTRMEGTTNDAPALSAALAALPPDGGRLVWAGTDLRISTAVDFNKPVTVVGTHRERSKLTVTGSKLVSISASSVTFTDIGFYGSGLADGSVLFNSEKTVTKSHRNWRFENCLFQSCGIVRFSKIGCVQTDGTVLVKGTDISGDLALIGCEVTGIRSAYGIEINGVDGVIVEGCHIHSNGIDATNGEGLKILGSSSNVRVALNQIDNNTRDGLDMYDCAVATVIGNDIHNNGVYGIEAKWAVSTAHTVDKFIVSNNRIYANATGGLNVDVPLSVVSGNQVYGNKGTGLRIGAAFDDASAATKYSIIDANVVSANTGNGILISNAGDSITVTSNQVHSNGASGIAFGAATVGAIISQNQCFGNAGRGISIGGTGHIIASNRSQDVGNFYLVSGSTAHTFMQAAGSAQTGLFASGYYYGPGGGRSTTTMTAGLLTFVPFWVGTATNFSMIGAEVTTAGAAGTALRLGIYRDSGKGLPDALILDAGKVDAATTGPKELSIAQALSPGLYWLAALAEVGAPVVRTVSAVGLTPVGAGSLATATGASSQSGHYRSGVAPGALPVPAGTFNGTTAGPALVVLKAS